MSNSDSDLSEEIADGMGEIEDQLDELALLVGLDKFPSYWHMFGIVLAKCDEWKKRAEDAERSLNAAQDALSRVTARLKTASLSDQELRARLRGREGGAGR